MASSKKKSGDNSTKREMLLTLSVGLAILTAFIAIAGREAHSMLYSVRSVISGLTGIMLWSLPFAFIGAGVFAFISKDNKDGVMKRWLLALALEACILSAVEVFYITKIEAEMGYAQYINFLSFAYRAHDGGGLLGAILAWPVTKLLTEWGAVLLFVLILLMLLVVMRVLSLSDLFRKKDKPVNTKEAEKSKKPVKPAARPAAKPVVKRSNEGLYSEDMSTGEFPANMRVRMPKLERGGAKREVTPVRSPGKSLEIPEVERIDPRPSKPRTKEKRREEPVEIEKIDLMQAVREEDPNERNKRYVDNALKSHSRKRKPVLTYSLDDTDEPKPKAKPAADIFDVPETKPEKPIKPAAKKEPAQPKPSYFDEPFTPPVKKPEPFAQPAKKAEPPKKPTPPPAKIELDEEYDYPPIDLIEAGDVVKTDSGYDSIDVERAETLVKTLQSFSIPVKLTGISHGPAVTRFELLPAPGIKVSRIASLADDIAMNLAAVSVRIEAPIPGKSAVGVEVPNVKKEIVHLRDVLESNDAREAASRLTVGLGKDNSGKLIVADLAKMPHVLIAGQTGSGKSVCINAIIISILYRATPDEVKLILIDPKMVELNAYNTIPHLLVPVVTDPKKAASALDWAVSEMTKRYKTFAEYGAKNIQSYNKKLEPGEKPMPQIVLIVDELADLMMTAPRDVEEAINRLAQLARAAGIHLVIATQRPSVDIITGVIKANIPTRIAFTVASGVDSRTVLDGYGAEKLLGYGDMLYLPSDRNKPIRIQGAWISEEEVQAVVDYISGSRTAEFDEDMLEHMENATLSDAEKHDKSKEQQDDGVDELFAEAVKTVVDAGQASISMLQRKLRVGYARAGRLIDEMASRGLVSQSEGSKSREVLITREQYQTMFSDDDITYT